MFFIRVLLRATILSVLFLGGTDLLGQCANFTVSATGGSFDFEISWDIVDEAGILQYSGIATVGDVVCLADGCYTVNLYDSFGDGWNGASFNVTDALGVTVQTFTLTNGSFGTYQLSIGGADCSGVVNDDYIAVDGSSFSATELITDVFLGDCLEATNILYTGAANAIGTFSNGSGIGIEEGIILSTGDITSAVGPNTSGSSGIDNFSAGNTLLDNLSGLMTFDAAVFTFDFVASTDEVSFDYVFASEEYPEFVCSSVNDAFGFFVSGPGYAPNTNISTIPGTTVPITIDNVNNDPFCTPNYPAYYVTNTGQSTQFDAYTVPLQAVIQTQPCETYQITIAVADGGDGIYDSAVFLRAQSFDAGIDVSAAAIGPNGSQSTSLNCGESGQYFFVNNGDEFTEETTVTYTLSGTGIPGVDYESFPLEVTFQPGEPFVYFNVEGIPNELMNGDETVYITLDNVCSCTTPEPIPLHLCPLLLLSNEYQYFDAFWEENSESVHCEWAGDYIQAEGFRVQRHVDDSQWSDIGETPYSDQANRYRFIDESPAEGWNYYRIVSVKASGDTEVSDVRSVWVEKNEAFVYPNPGSGLFAIPKSKQSGMMILNSLGQKVDFRWVNDAEIELIQPAPGIYFFHAIDASGVGFVDKVQVN